MKGNKFVVYSPPSGTIRFQFILDNGALVLESPDFNVKQSCISAIVSAKLHGKSDRNFQKLKDKGRGYYFNLRTKKTDVLATSVFYSSPVIREQAIREVREQIQQAEIEDRCATSSHI